MLYIIYQPISDSQLHEIGYTQHFDVPLRRVRTLDLCLDRSERQRNRLFFHGFLPAMASDHTPMNYYRV